MTRYAKSKYKNPFSNGVPQPNRASQGWGSGWPNCQGSKMASVVAQDQTKGENYDIKVTVRKEIAPMVAALLEATDKLYDVNQHDTGAYNCLGAATPVLTRDGWFPIGELSGTEVELLTASAQGGPGRWVTAPIKSYGMQPLMRITLSRLGATEEIYATAEHRWFVNGRDTASRVKELTTAELVAGLRLKHCSPQSVATRTSPSPVGVQAGLVYGDGTRSKHDGRIMLCGEKNEALLSWFSPTQPRATYAEGTLVTGLPKSWKEQPRLDEGSSYLYGWLAGYFAADGRVSESGTPELNSADLDSLEFARRVALQLGIASTAITSVKRLGYGEEVTSLHSLRLDPRSLDSDFFLIPAHRENWNSADRQSPVRWTVVSVEETDRNETVYCAEVPETESFVIGEWILTGNCRPIAGTQRASNHFWGLAVDINWEDNPQGSWSSSVIPPAVVAMWIACGWGWGGFYRGTPDLMHFEYLGSPSDVAKDTKKALAYLDPAPAPKPKPTPAPKPPAVDPAFTKKLGAKVAPGGHDPQVADLQRLLVLAGYGPIEGTPPYTLFYGGNTEAAVSRYLAAHPEYASRAHDVAIGPLGYANLQKLALKAKGK